LNHILILPKPKKLELRKGKVDLSQGVSVRLKDERGPRRPMMLLTRGLREMGLRVTVEEGFPITLSVEKEVNNRYGEEGYILDIAKEEARIIGGSEIGVLHGVRTFTLLVRTHGVEMPCMRIEDFPDLSLRGVHIDLKCQMRRSKYLLELLSLLSEYKANAVLLEYEDKFPYRRHSIISAPDALTREEVRLFLEEADAHYIEVIPLLQSLGHVEYILRHEVYAKLREAGSIYQFCPSNKDSIKLFSELAEEIFELHENIKYFHVGGDETHLLGACDICAERVCRIGKGGLYAEHMMNIRDVIKNMGARPMIWGDMLITHPDALRKLSKDFIIVDWDYWSTGELVDRVLIYTVGAFDSSNIDKVPEDLRRVYEPYWKSSVPGKFRGFPYTKFFKDQGFSVVVASSTRSYGDTYIAPNYTRHLPNIMGFSREAKRQSAIGHIVTSWAIRRCPPETTWIGLMCGIAYSWNVHTDEEYFKRAYALCLHGLDNGRLIDLMMALGAKMPTLESRPRYNPARGLWERDICLKEELEQLFRSPEVKHHMNTVQRMRRAAHELLETLSSSRPRWNRRAIEVWRLEAMTMRHKCEFLLTMYKAWRIFRGELSASRASIKSLIEELSRLRKELWMLRSEATRILGPVLTERALLEELWMRYDEEASLLNETIDRLARLLTSKD